MAGKTSRTSAKGAKKAAAKRIAAGAAKPRKTALKSQVRKAAKPRTPLWRQPADREGLRRCPRAGLYRSHAGWKRDVGRRLDALIARAVPAVRKAVKWNSPFYGLEDQVWFLSFHCFAKYVKVAFFRGASLRPIPPGESAKGGALPRHPRGRQAR